MKIGYARVSTKHQRDSLDQQIALLKSSGCGKVFSEIVSGSSIKRAELKALIHTIKAGETLVITSIDRLGRSLKDLIDIITHLKEKQIGFQTLKEQMDTNTPTGMLMFNMMASIAEFERSLINSRIYDGVQRAKEQGKYKGRKHVVDEKMRKNYVKMINSGEYSIAYIAKMARVSRQTLYNWKIEQENVQEKLIDC